MQMCINIVFVKETLFSGYILFIYGQQISFILLSGMQQANVTHDAFSPEVPPDQD